MQSRSGSLVVWAGRSIGFRAFPYYHLVTPDLRSLSKVKRRKFLFSNLRR